MGEQLLQKAITSLRRINCAQLFFIYPGRWAGLHGQGESFLSMMRGAGLGDRNLALIADPYGENYTRGVSADISDLQSLLAWHKKLLQELSHVTEFYHLGHSSGGYGALLFGHLLGAKKVWAFAPRTARRETADATKAFLKERLFTPGGSTEFIIYYSPFNRKDCAFAEYFAQCPGVMLSPYALPPPNGAERTGSLPMDVESYYHHGVFTTAVRSGQLRQLLPPFLAASENKPPPRATV